MAPRYSNPSSGLGVNRFRVWPNKTTDSYNTADLVANFDKIDAMFGIPSAGTAWPTSEGVDGGVYKEIQLLKGSLGGTSVTPLGTVIAWWRPNGGIAIPTGWVEVKGQTLTSLQHGFAGGGSITLPDLRHKIIIGADSTFTPLQASVSVGDANIDTASGAAGLGYVSGSNQSILAVAHMPSHNHGGGVHGHAVTDAGHVHGVIDGGHNHGGGGTTSGPSIGIQEVNVGHTWGVYDGGFWNPSPTSSHTHTFTIPTDNAHLTIQTANSNISVATSGTIITSQGSSSPFDNRQGSVALIYLMRVL